MHYFDIQKRKKKIVNGNERVSVQLGEIRSSDINVSFGVTQFHFCQKTNKHLESAKYRFDESEFLNMGGSVSVSAGSKEQVLPSEGQVPKQKLSVVWLIIQC